MKKTLILLLCLFLTIPALANAQRVYDNAGLFTDEEVQQLEEMIEQFRQRTRTDFAVLTTDDFLGNVEDSQIMQLANDFYDKMGFGLGPDSSGALYYLDMYNCAPCISTCGACITILKGPALDGIFDAAWPSLSKGQWFDAAEKTLQAIEAVLNDYWAQSLAD